VPKQYTENELLFFSFNNGYTKAPQCLRALPIMCLSVLVCLFVHINSQHYLSFHFIIMLLHCTSFNAVLLFNNDRRINNSYVYQNVNYPCFNTRC